jgi:hypothetical protein
MLEWCLVLYSGATVAFGLLFGVNNPPETAFEWLVLAAFAAAWPVVCLVSTAGEGV